MMMTKNLVMGMFKTCSSRSAATLATSSSKMMIIFFSTTADSPLPLLASTTTPITTGKSLCRCPHHLSLVWNRCPRHLSLDWEPNIRPLSPHLVKLMSVFEFPAYNLRITEDESFKAELNSIGSLHASALSAHFASMRKKHKWEHICSFFLEWISLNPDHTDIKLFNSYLLSAIMLGDSMASVMNFVVEMEGYVGSSAKTYSYLFQTLFERGGVGFDEIFCSDMNVWGEIELQEIVNGLINTQVYNSLGISIVLIFIIVGIGFKLSPDVKMQKKGHLINNTSFTCILDASLKRNEIDFASKLIEDGSESGCKISLGTFIELVRVSVMQNMVDSLVSYSEKLKVHSYLRGADSPPWWLCNYMIGVALVVKNNKLACIALDFMNSKIDEEGKSFFYFVDREKLESLIVLACNTSDPKLLYCSWKLLRHSST